MTGSTALPEPDHVQTELEKRLQSLGPTPEGLQIDKHDAEDYEVFRERRRKAADPEQNKYDNGPIMKIITGYTMTPEQHAAWRTYFPRIRLDPGVSYTGHDHPISHAATLVGIRYIQNMFRPGERVCDVYGNPTANEKTNLYFKRRSERPRNPIAAPTIDTWVKHKTASDYVRQKTKWGPRCRPDGSLRWYEGDMFEINKEYDTYIGIHTLYYQSMSDKAKFLSDKPNARCLELVNFDANPDCKLWGELRQIKNNGVTTQTSPNGERYQHANIDPWFRQFSYACGLPLNRKGIAWTIHSLGGPMHVIEIVAANPDMCEQGYARDKDEVDEIHLVVDSAGAKPSWNGWVSMNDTSVRIKLTNYSLAANLRHWMTLRARDASTFKDLCTKARRVTAPDIVTGTVEFPIGPGELADHIVYAYLADAPGEKILTDGVRMLRGELLIPLNTGLAMEGDDVHQGIFTAIQRLFVSGTANRPRGLDAKSSNSNVTGGKVNLSKLTRK